LLLLIVTNN